MSVEDAVLMLLDSHWREVWEALPPPSRERLSDGLRRLVAAGDDERARGNALLDINDVLAEELPREHPVNQAAEGSRRWATGGGGTAELAGLALARGVEIAQLEAQERLYAAPGLSAADLRARGEDPERPFLIRLDLEDRGVRFPGFQFDDTGHAIPVVLAVNEHLEADEDPWGAADWWLEENAWLDAVPAALIGRTDVDLVAAADVLAEGGQ